MNWSGLMPWVCASLNSGAVWELLYWTETELYHYAEQALHDIGGRFLLCVEFDGTTALVADQAFYPVPEHHIATIYASANGTFLKPSTVLEMESLDDGWEDASSAPPQRWVGDTLGLAVIRAYPPPDAPGTLELIYHQHPPDLTPTAPSVLMPAPIADYLAVRALQDARERQSDGQMADAAAGFGILAQIYEQAIAGYWGQSS